MSLCHFIKVPIRRHAKISNVHASDQTHTSWCAHMPELSNQPRPQSTPDTPPAHINYVKKRNPPKFRSTYSTTSRRLKTAADVLPNPRLPRTNINFQPLCLSVLSTTEHFIFNSPDTSTQRAINSNTVRSNFNSQRSRLHSPPTSPPCPLNHFLYLIANVQPNSQQNALSSH